MIPKRKETMNKAQHKKKIRNHPKQEKTNFNILEYKLTVAGSQGAPKINQFRSTGRFRG